MSVHNNTKQAPIDKFNYLNPLLVKSASEAISKLSLTNANYAEAVTILRRRFGVWGLGLGGLIINRDMETLSNSDKAFMGSLRTNTGSSAK